MSAIDSGRITKIYPHAVKRYLSDHMGMIFEKMCRDYASALGKGNNYHYYIFSKSGFTEGLFQAKERGKVQLITPEGLYK